MPHTVREQEMTMPTKHNDLHFKHLPAYAQFLLDRQLPAFSRALLRISREVDVPLLRYFASMPEEALIALSSQGTQDLLTHFSQNQVQAFIDKSITSWVENQLPQIQSSEVVVEDILKISFARRKAFREFLPLYSTEVITSLAIMEEVDIFTVNLEEICYKILFEMKQQKINEHRQRLELSEELHKQAQALTHLGNWSWLIHEDKITWSDEMYRIYGLPPQSEAITFERFMSLVHPEDRAQRQQEIQRALQTHHAEDYTMRIVLDDGTIKILQGKGEVLVDEDNKPYKLVGTCQDVTLEKNAELELEQQRNQLARKNVELERSNQELMAFNYIASHDLKEPVRKINIFSSLIIDRSRDILPENVKNYVERISAAAAHMQKLIDALYTFSRTASADQTLEYTDVNTLLEEVKTSLQEDIAEKMAIIHTSPLPGLYVIPFQFRQLLENILCNALKYSRPGIRPDINITSALVSGSAFVQEGAEAERNYYAISMRDNGIGFDQKYAPKIFDLFQRLHAKNEYSGTGIGLAICKKIAQHHHGFITACGEPDRGATFTIYIPA